MLRTLSRRLAAWIDGLDRLAAMHPGVIAVSMEARAEQPRREHIPSAARATPDKGELVAAAEIALRHPAAYTEL